MSEMNSEKSYDDIYEDRITEIIPIREYCYYFMVDRLRTSSIKARARTRVRMHTNTNTHTYTNPRN